ncbi:hydrolase 2, exosortase A system-associated [Magnetospira sp. QH-2]|uniref:hydrolase 2, exosortase A system-associated n=1 Tax=Magnetospira sp. (strain QH-2) TaxID=1288970 RepID=UPI0003E81275|nr:hydrolase 2, exosortase A system-associated [Magnetospira sp. QH-2]CCQ72975.1 conserved protein of unknown function [hydrolase superfamily domain] [Magnetospira sp. QH-2]
MAADREPQFLQGPNGPLFTLRIGPAAAQARAALIYVPPFAEEGNRSRRVAVDLAETLAPLGMATLLLDPYGTGDSGGDLDSVRWSTWIEDVRAATGWLRESGYETISLLGLRLGAGLACAAADGTTERVILWQPVLKGPTFLTQFLRIRVAAGLGGAQETVKDLRARWDAGETLEVAGYALSAALAKDLDQWTLANPGVPVDWFQVGGEALNPAASTCLAQWGATSRAQVVSGEAFWSIEEVVAADDLVAATAALWQDKP